MKAVGQVVIGVCVGGATLTRRIVNALERSEWSFAPKPNVVPVAKGHILSGFDLLVLDSMAALTRSGISQGGADGTVPTIVVVLDGEDDPALAQIIALGACTIVDRDDPECRLVRAAEEAIDGSFWVSPVFVTRLRALLATAADRGHADPPSPSHGETLTPREREVLRLLAQGLSNGQIGAALGVTTGAVKFHVSNLLRKYSCERRSQLIIMIRPSVYDGCLA